jgi:cytochrome c-type biogenesis protein CcmH
MAGVLLAVALLFVLPPLLRSRVKREKVDRKASNVSIYQDQLAELEADLKTGGISAEQYALSKAEIERRLLEDVTTDSTDAVHSAGGRVAAAVVGIAIPVIAVLMYRALGEPEGINPSSPPPSQHAAQGGPMTPERIMEMVDNLAQRLEQNPNDGQGWAMLGRSYVALQRYTEAVAAFEKASNLITDDAQMLTDYADVLALVSGKKFDGKPMALIEKALQIDPNNIKGLALAGSASYQSRNYRQAIVYWEKLLQILPPQMPLAQRINNFIADARAMAEGRTPPSQMAAAQQAAQSGGQAASGGTQVSGTVTLSPALAGKVAPGDTLFVFAKAPSGPPMPLAVMRAQAKDLPLKFALNDGMAMAPMMRLSRFPEVMISAKISKSGSATPQSGDLTGSTPGPVKVGASGVQLTIDKVTP